MMVDNNGNRAGLRQIDNADGSYSDIFYMDDNGNACDKTVAKRCIIRELDADGNLIQETFGFVN